MAIDWTILDGIQKIFGGSFMDWLMPKITVLGNGGIVWIIIAVCLILTKKHRKSRLFSFNRNVTGAYNRKWHPKECNSQIKTMLD